MKHTGAAVFMALASLIMVHRGFISGSIGISSDDVVTDELLHGLQGNLLAFETQPKNQWNASFVVGNGKFNVDDADDRYEASPNDLGAAVSVSNGVSGEPVHSFYPDQTLVVPPIYGNPYLCQQIGYTGLNYHAMNTPQSFSHIPQGGQALTNLLYSGQPYGYPCQQLGDSIIHSSDQSPIGFNSENPVPLGDMPVALEIRNDIWALPKISDFESELKEKMEKDGLCVTIGLSHRIISKENSSFSNGIIYSPFVGGSYKSPWGRVGRLELYFHVRGPLVSFFEMEFGFNPPKGTRTQSKLGIDKLGKLFKNAKWSIHIRPSGKLAKIGADPSDIMTLWAITDEEIKAINLKEKFTRELSLEKGGLIVAIPTKLNYIMQKVEGGKTYQEFLAFIEPYANLGLDILIFIVEVRGGIVTRTAPDGAPNKSMNSLHPNQPDILAFNNDLNQLSVNANFDNTADTLQNSYYPTYYEPINGIDSNQPPIDTSFGDNVANTQPNFYYLTSYGSLDVLHPDLVNAAPLYHVDPYSYQLYADPNYYNTINASGSFSHSMPLGGQFGSNDDYQIYPHVNDIVTLYGQPAALEKPNIVLGPAKISDIDFNLERKIKRLGFRISKTQKLVRRQVPVAGSNCGPHFKGIAYFPFLKESGKLTLWGRTGKPELYIRAGKSSAFLFEMKPGSDPPKSFKDEIRLDLNKFKAKFKNTKWAIQISASGELVKVGDDDPSESMILSMIANGKVDEVDLKAPEIAMRLPLKEGDLVTAIPRQSNNIMKVVRWEETYQAFLDFINLYIDRSLDQLVLILKVKL